MKSLQKYYRSIEQALPCTGCQRRKLMQDIRHSVQSFLQEHPDVSIKEISARFGTPQQIAYTYTAEMSPQELQEKLKVKKWIIGIIAGAMACVLLIWGIAIGIALENELKNSDGYMETNSLVIEAWEEFE